MIVHIGNIQIFHQHQKVKNDMENEHDDWNLGDTIIQEIKIDPVKLECGFSFSFKCGTVHNNGNQLLKIKIIHLRTKECYRSMIIVNYIPIDRIKQFAEDLCSIICKNILLSEKKTRDRVLTSANNLIRIIGIK
jgi:hypothetical protein